MGFVDRGNNVVLRATGVALLLSCPLLFVSPFFLLKKYGGAKEGEQFFNTNVTVARGLYAISWHPQYLGYMILMLGFVPLSQHVVRVAFGVVGITFFYLHTVQEEKFYKEQLGKEYAEYASDVRRFNILLGLFRRCCRRRVK